MFVATFAVASDSTRIMFKVTHELGQLGLSMGCVAQELPSSRPSDLDQTKRWSMASGLGRPGFLSGAKLICAAALIRTLQAQGSVLVSGAHANYRFSFRVRG